MVGRSDLYMDFGKVDLSGVGTSGKEGENVLNIGTDRAKGCIFEARFPGLEGSGNIEVKVQHSDDGTTFTDLVTTGEKAVSEVKGTLLEVAIGSHKKYLRMFVIPSATLTGAVRGELNTKR